jgi:hypothetical protein
MMDRVRETLAAKSNLFSGFLGWFLINSIIWLLLDYAVFHYRAYGLVCFILPINITILIALSFKQRQFAWGMLAAYLVNLLIAAGLRVSFWGILGIPFTLLIYYD